MNKKMYCSIEQAKRLKELGVVQQSEAFWENGELENHHMYTHGAPINPVSAYSLGELLAMLPDRWYYWYVLDDAYKSGMQFRCGDDTYSPYHYIGLTPCEAIGSTIILEATHNKEFSIEAINARYLEAIKE